jgi:CRISPR-associated protein Csm1
MVDQIKVQDVYVAALLSGLIPAGQIELAQGESALLEKARTLLRRNTQTSAIHALQAITGRVWNAGLKKYYNPGRINLEEASTVFPGPEGVPPPVTAELLEEMNAEIARIAAMYSSDAPALRHTLYHTLYAWGARMSFGDTDVSVFDQNRLLAATVQCLKVAPEASNFLLLKGAVSGIQSFIYYDIGGEQIGDARTASKRLRGRSFLVAHLCQVIAEYLVDELGMEQANILFVGGGHFNLLLPDTEAIRKLIGVLKRRLNKALFMQVGMQLGLLLECESAESESLFQNANEYFRKVSDRLEYSKQQRYIDNLDTFFESKGKWPEYKEDEKIGKLIPYADYLLEVKLKEPVPDGFNKALRPDIMTFQFIGRYYFVIQRQYYNRINSIIDEYGEAIYSAGGSIKLTRLNNTDFLPSQPFAYPVKSGFEFIGNEAPKALDKQNREETVMLFEDIAKMGDNTNKELSFPQLAAMRLDVDDLGTLFQYGFGASASFERIASLSREFQLFFGGYFNVLARQHNLYITYSGGDDAFVIGSWLNVVKFAYKLNAAFREFSCGNDHVAFSAGIFLCSPYYPVVRFAEDAAELLESKAKNWDTKNKVGKNAICLFNQTMYWWRFEDMMKFADKLVNVVPREDEKISEGKASVSTIRRSLLQHFLATIQASKRGDFEFYRNIGRLHGLVSRHGYRKDQLEKQLRSKESAAEIIQTLLQGSGSKEEFADYILPLQYILYLTRVKNL